MTNKTVLTSTQKLSLLSRLFAFVCLVCVVWFASAQTTLAVTGEPVCSLYYFHNGLVEETKSQARIQVSKNDIVGLLWNARNTSAAIDGNSKKIDSLGSQIITPTRNVSYTYTFSQGSQKVTCGIEIEVVSASITTKSTVKSGVKIILEGKVEGVNKVMVKIFPAGTTTPAYSTKSLTVKNEKFSFRIPKSLPDGNYRIVVQTNAQIPLVLATSTIVVGKAVPVALTTLVIQKIPLLAGGTAKVGSGVAAAYLQVINVGMNPANITGFTFGQYGTAPASVMTGVSITDELGTARGAVGNMISGTPFVGSQIFIPLVTTLAPQESRLFTVRAVVSATALGNVGQTISLALLGLGADARVQSTLPLTSVVWTIGR